MKWGHRKLLGWIFLLATVAGPAVAQDDQSDRLYEFMARPLGFGLIQPLAKLRKIGPLRSEKIAGQSTNRYNADKIDEARILTFDGLVIHVTFPEKNYRRGLVTEINVTKAKWRMAHGIRVGSKKSDVTAALGEGKGESEHGFPGEVKYCEDKVCGTLVFRDERVHEILIEMTPE